MRQSLAAVYGATGQQRDGGEGAEQSMIDTIQRQDGTLQVTYNGHPLYYFVKDEGATEPQGEGIEAFGGKWYLVTPAGEELEKEGAGQETPSVSATATVTGTSSYQY